MISAIVKNVSFLRVYILCLKTDRLPKEGRLVRVETVDNFSVTNNARLLDGKRMNVILCASLPYNIYHEGILFYNVQFGPFSKRRAFNPPLHTARAPPVEYPEYAADGTPRMRVHTYTRIYCLIYLSTYYI